MELKGSSFIQLQPLISPTLVCSEAHDSEDHLPRHSRSKGRAEGSRSGSLASFGMINPFFANHGILKHVMDNDGNSRVITINQTGHQINMNMTTPPFKCPLSSMPCA